MTLASKIGHAFVKARNFFTPPFAGVMAEIYDSPVKGFVSNDFLYRPPYGFPRSIDAPTIRALARTPYIYMVTSTIIDEVASMEYDVLPKSTDDPAGYVEQNDDSKNEADKNKHLIRQTPPETLAHIQELKGFFQHPNENNESFEFLIRAFLRDALELDSGVWIKVFNEAGKFTQLFARDGATFLKNPDIHGYMGNRAEYVAPIPLSLSNNEIKDYYNTYIANEAAYFQYGWIAMHPIPFGLREVVFGIKNARSDSIYGRSAVEILEEFIKVLLYGSRYNLDMYINDNMPEGALIMEGASQVDIDGFRERFQKKFLEKDEFGTKVKKFFRSVILNKKSEYIQFQLKPADMQIIEQQKWFSKLVWACFGINASELGFTEDSNRSTELGQNKVFKRKAVKPLLRLLEFLINTHIVSEFGYDDVEFRFIEYDLAEDIEKHKLYEIQLKNGISNVNEVREDMGKTPIPDGFEYRTPGAFGEGPFGNGDDSDGNGKDFNRASSEATGDENKKQADQKAMGAKPPLALSGGEQKKKKDSKKKDTTSGVILDYLKGREKVIVEELRKIFDSNMLGQVKAFQNLWERLIEALEGIFGTEQLKSVTDQFTKLFYTKGMNQVDEDIGRNFFPNQNAIGFLEDYNFDMVKNMTEELTNKLKSTLQRAYMNDVPFAEIKKDVQGIFNTNEARAEAIVRTESNRAESFGELDAASQAKFEMGKSILNPSPESPICKRLIKKYGNKLIGLDENFKDPLTGDEFKGSPFHINCKTRLVTERTKK